MDRSQDGSDVINWNDDFNQIVAGGLLGDGSMSLGRWAVTPTYHENHGFRQRDYVGWKCYFLGASMGEYTTFDNRTCKFYPHSSLWITDPRNRALYHAFYPAGKKVVTYDVLMNINEVGLTVLWLDDGTTKLHDGNGKISLQGFSPEENRWVMQWLAKRFGIGSVLTPENEVFFNSEEMQKLFSIVHPVFQSYGFPECMRYKMGRLDPANVELVEEARQRRRERDMGYYRRKVADPIRNARLREAARDAQRRRLKDPAYRSKYNEYHKEYARRWRATHGE